MASSMTGEAKRADTVADEVPETATDTTGDEPSQRRRTPWQRVAAVVWDSLDKPPEERRLIAKLDWFILSYVCLAYFVKYLDQTNVSNAYVSGMKEDLHMKGNDLNYMTTYWTIGYILGQVPSQIVLTRVPFSVWLPSLELIWSLLVIGMAGAKNVHTLYALRFFVGLLEASAYPGIMTLLGSWYRPDELAKRACIYQASSSVAQMFSGYLQAGLYEHMDGRNGLAAWRWLFVFDGVLGVPIALYGFFAVPNSPTTTRARWLSAAEKQMAVDRMAALGRRPALRITRRTLRRTLRSLGHLFREWPVYLFTASFLCYIQATRVYAYFNVWLKATHRYSVAQINEIPTAGFGILVVCTLLFAWASDGFGTRWPIIVVGASLSLIGAIILSVSVVPDGHGPTILAGFFLTYITTGTAGIYMTYITEVLSYNYLHRAFVIAFADTAAYVFVAWLPLVIFNTGEAPWFSVGYTMTAVFLGLQIFFILLVALANRYWAVGKYEEDEEEEDTATEQPGQPEVVQASRPAAAV